MQPLLAITDLGRRIHCEEPAENAVCGRPAGFGELYQVVLLQDGDKLLLVSGLEGGQIFSRYPEGQTRQGSHR